MSNSLNAVDASAYVRSSFLAEARPFPFETTSVGISVRRLLRSPYGSLCMPKSIFDRDVFFKMEQTNNPFIAARALSQRAREVNSRQRDEGQEESVSAPALALEDYLEGRISIKGAPEESAL